MSRLITTSLISSIEWYKHAPWNWSNKAEQDLKNMLGRIRTPMPFYAKRGIEFENQLYKNVNNEHINASETFKYFIEKIKGGEFQRKTKTFLKVGNYEYCLYGKIDVFFKDHLIDIKTTSKWDDWSESKYRDSFQHIIYCYNENIEKFIYLIAQFDGRNNNIVNKYEIEITKNLLKKEDLEKLLINKIKSVIIFFENNKELYDLYLDKYCLY